MLPKVSNAQLVLQDISQIISYVLSAHRLANLVMDWQTALFVRIRIVLLEDYVPVMHLFHTLLMMEYVCPALL